VYEPTGLMLLVPPWSLSVASEYKPEIQEILAKRFSSGFAHLRCFLCFWAAGSSDPKSGLGESKGSLKGMRHWFWVESRSWVFLGTFSVFWIVRIVLDVRCLHGVLVKFRLLDGIEVRE
jgi:hypothetical protein